MPEVDEFQILLGSPDVAEILDKKYGLLHDVFRGSWDAKNNRWAQPDWKDRLHDRIVMALGGIQKVGLDDYDLANFLGQLTCRSPFGFGSVGGISMNTDRPEDAKRWLNIVIYEVSDIIRSQMINQRQNYVNYLQQQLSQSSLTTSRDATISILADQYRALMVLKAPRHSLCSRSSRRHAGIPDEQICIAFYLVRDRWRADGSGSSYCLRNSGMPRFGGFFQLFSCVEKQNRNYPRRCQKEQ